MESKKVTKLLPATRHLVFFSVLFALVGFAVARSSIATRLDSFTVDEPYHIGAGVTYFQTGDFRLNPEHPPLIKLWTGAFVSNIGYQRSAFRTFQDKNDERDFVENDVYFNNDPDVIQSRSRKAMFTLNGLLMCLFALAARRLFGEVIALAATAFLMIDPTVAAHLPVVMTDLPVALLSTSAVMLAVAGFRSWRAVDLVLASITLGLALSAKHSAVITMAAVAIIGIVMAISSARDARIVVRLRLVGLVGAVLIGAVFVLWSSYLFRFSESPSTSEQLFNRPLAEKINDVKSPLYRTGLTLLARGHLFPRAYIWGMADTIRAGAEGRAQSIFAFGSVYYSKAPFYYFPGVIAVKLPLGLLLLTVIGAVLLIVHKTPRELTVPMFGVIGLAGLFLIVLGTGSTYAGIRHAMPVIPPLALLASLAIYKAVKSASYFLRGTVAMALIAALLSAIPVLRPWEYYNETIGGAANGYRYFDDEGVDLSLRKKELAEYYNQNLKPMNEVPYIYYPGSYKERKRRGVDWVGKNPERDREKMNSEIVSGTYIIGAKLLAHKLWWDEPAFRAATPVARFGNLFVFRGTFNAPEIKARSLYYDAIDEVYTAKPDTEKAIELLSQSVTIDPKAFFVALELGNQYLKVGKREEALRAYKIAQDNAPMSDEISKLLAHQIERVTTESLEQISPLRNPEVE
jgi:tetratricopeptide (TPR) repeat protein